MVLDGQSKCLRKIDFLMAKPELNKKMAFDTKRESYLPTYPPSQSVNSFD